MGMKDREGKNEKKKKVPKLTRTNLKNQQPRIRRAKERRMIVPRHLVRRLAMVLARWTQHLPATGPTLHREAVVEERTVPRVFLCSLVVVAVYVGGVVPELFGARGWVDFVLVFELRDGGFGGVVVEWLFH